MTGARAHDLESSAGVKTTNATRRVEAELKHESAAG